MVLGGNRGKNKIHLMKVTQTRTAAKAAPAPSSSYTASVHSHRQKQMQPDSPAESENELIPSQDYSQISTISPTLLQQFERMLHKALNQTSEQITNSLTKEIRELGNRTTTLELAHKIACMKWIN